MTRAFLILLISFISFEIYAEVVSPGSSSETGISPYESTSEALSHPAAAASSPIGSCGLVLNAPIEFNFDGPAWIPPVFTNTGGAMESCWLVTSSGANTFWSVGPPHKTRFNTGPKSDHTTGYGNYLVLNGQGISTDTLSRIRTPGINLTGITNPQITFWYHMYGEDIDSLEIMVRNTIGGTWDTLYTIVGQQHFTQDDPWSTMDLSLSGYANNTVNLQFVGYGEGTRVQMAIDDISIQDSSTCKPSTFFRHISVNDTSVLLDWDEGTGSVHKIEYGKKGFVPGTGTKITANQPPFRITNLSPDTVYSFYLRDDCSSTQFSTWVGPLDVNTDCPAIAAPFFEDFEGPTWPSGGLQHCWDRYTYRDFRWAIGPPALSWQQSGPGFNNHTPGGSQFIVADRLSQLGDPRSSLVTPLIDLDTIANPELVFWTHMFGLHIGAFEISIDSGNGFELLKTIVGTQQIAKSDPWTEQIFALPAYSGKKIKVKFTGIASNNTAVLSRIAVDDFFIGEAPSCRKPVDLKLANRGFLSAKVEWISGGSSNWMVKLKPTGSQDSIYASSNNPLALEELDPGSEYTIWVRDSCGIGDVSEWSAPLVFRTYCLPDSVPYFQDFESSQFVVRSSWFFPGVMAPCWERSHEIGPMWQPSPATSFPNTNLPAADHTTGFGKYMGGTLFLANGTIEYTSFTSPHIDISGFGNPKLSYWYFMGGFNSFSTNKLVVEVNSGSGWQPIHTEFGPIQISTSDPWLYEELDLKDFIGDTIRLRFKSIGSHLHAGTSVGIDDILIFNDPCLEPSNLAADYVGSTNAMLSWTSGGATDWILKYKTDGGSFMYVGTSVDTTHNLKGLLPDTRYEIWVRDSCGLDVSTWHGPIYFRTECLPTQVPYYEGFDGGLWTPSAVPSDPGVVNSCWRRSDTMHYAWKPQSGSNLSSLSGPAGSRSGSGNYMITSILSPIGGNNTNLVELRSPLVINSGLQQPELNFWFHMYGSQIQKLKIYLEKTNDTRSAIDSLIGQQQTSRTDPWQQRTIPLSAFQNDTFKIVFEAEIGNSLALVNAAIDDVEIIDAICSDPSNLSASNISSSAADLNWVSVSAHSSIQYGLAGFALGSGAVVKGVWPGYNLTGLQPFTTYEYYVQDSCRTGSSQWAGPYSFTTSCALLTADFSYQGPSLTVGFDASNSAGTALNYQWDFGDGNSGTGLNPSHTYAASGMYSVAMITTDTCGLRDTIIKNIQVCETPQALIIHSRSGLSVSFDGRSSAGAVQYFWNLGAVGTFTTDTFTTAFPAKGTYPIYLVVTNPCGSRDTSFMNLVICDKPIASFKAKITTVINPAMIVDFDGTASAYADSYIWNFGDGNTNTSTLTPTHVYSTSNLNYLVTLIVKADCGLSDTLSYKLSSISLPESEELRMAVFPNPANNRLTLSIPDREVIDTDILWFDLSGKLLNVPLISSKEGSFEFDVSKLPTGEYFLVNRLPKGGAIKVVIKRDH